MRLQFILDLLTLLKLYIIYVSCRSDDTGDRQASCKEGGDYKCDEDDRGERDENEEESEGRSRLVYFLRKWFSYSRFRAKEQGWNEMQQQEYALVSQEIL